MDPFHVNFFLHFSRIVPCGFAFGGVGMLPAFALAAALPALDPLALPALDPLALPALEPFALPASDIWPIFATVGGTPENTSRVLLLCYFRDVMVLAVVLFLCMAPGAHEQPPL